MQKGLVLADARQRASDGEWSLHYRSAREPKWRLELVPELPSP